MTGWALLCANRWSTGMASSASSRSRGSNANPSGCATGTRKKPQCRRWAATASVISAALFSLTLSKMSGCDLRQVRSTSGVKACAAAEPGEAYAQMAPLTARIRLDALLHGAKVAQQPLGFCAQAHGPDR